MTDLPKSAADQVANLSAPDDETAQMPIEGDVAGDPAPEASPDAIAADTPAPDEPIDATAAETSQASEPDIEVVPVEPVAAAVAEGAAPTQPRRRRSLVLRFGVAFVLGFALVVAVGGGVMYAWAKQYDGRVLPGVRIGSANLGGLTREQAEAEIANAYGSLGAGEITLTGPDNQATIISYADLGRGPDTSSLVDAAMAVGREDEPITNLIGAARAAIHGVTLDSVVAYDHDKLEAAIESLAKTIDRTPYNAFVSAGQDGKYDIVPAKEGRAVDKAALLAELDRQLASIDTSSSIAMAVPVKQLVPVFSTTSADTAKAAADRMAADLIVTRGEDSWTIAGTTLAPLISFSAGPNGTIATAFDESGLDPLIKALAKQVDRSPRDAGLKVINGHVVATGASREGRTLKVPEMKAAIVAQITGRQAGTAASAVPAVVKAVNPKLSSADAEAFAGKMRPISSYSVFYWVIINNHFGGNIEAPATKINGTVVPAGGKFDFWNVVGDLRKLPGEGPGNAIEGGKITVTGAFGGGICTTSTTLFNAAFRAGMIPLARQNHNEFISRYPPGLDATVWIVGGTKQTMSFRNDTPYPILITRTVRNAPGNKRWLTFKIWSVPNGRTYRISNLVIHNGPRAIDTVVYDPNKPAGYVFRNNAPADGAKVWVTVSIYDHGKLHWTKRYFSNYPAVNGVLIKGTG
jgi:vancomycin resistance protein YoaR